MTIEDPEQLAVLRNLLSDALRHRGYVETATTEKSAMLAAANSTLFFIAQIDAAGRAAAQAEGNGAGPDAELPEIPEIANRR